MLVLLVFLFANICGCEKTTYKAAAVVLKTMENVPHYDKLIAEAAGKGADIIVFPECSVMDVRAIFPEYINVGDNPCDKTWLKNRLLRKVSCAARKNKLYTVVGMYEHGQSCNRTEPDCTVLGFYIYNSQAVFDKDGTIIAKYRKTHITEEMCHVFHPGKSGPTNFTTDFGVTFGMFICYDILFPHPPSDYSERLGIYDIVFSTMWVDVIPATALQVQLAFSEFFGVNFIGSNTMHNTVEPSGDSNGGGIYSSGNVIDYNMIKETTIVYGELPIRKAKDRKKLPHRSLKGRLPPEGPNYENQTFIFKSSPGYEHSVELKVSSGTCKVSWKISSENASVVENFVVATGNDPVRGRVMELCGIINCGDEKCVLGHQHNIDAVTKFEYVNIEHTYSQTPNVFTEWALLATDKKALFPNGCFKITHNESTHTVTSQGDFSKHPLLYVDMLGLYSDGPPPTRRLW